MSSYYFIELRNAKSTIPHAMNNAPPTNPDTSPESIEPKSASPPKTMPIMAKIFTVVFI